MEKYNKSLYSNNSDLRTLVTKLAESVFGKGCSNRV